MQSAPPTVTVLTDAQAAEFTRRRETLSLECAAATPRCAGCDDEALDGDGHCQHDCHDEAESHDAALTAMRNRSTMLAKQAKDAYAQGIRDTAAKIALEIRCELVCCDVYDRLAPLRAEVEAVRPGWGEAYREWVDAIGEHDICYWSEASARIAESVGRGDRSPDLNDTTGDAT
jgi:hypothetical protein